MKVHQVLAVAGPYDAVTSQAIAYRRVLAQWGLSGRDVAGHAEPGVDGSIGRMPALAPAPDDVVLVHYSGYTPGLEDLIEGAGRSILVFHNITPARWFWAHHPVEGVRCELARAQLQRVVPQVDVAVGVSEFNAAELRSAGARTTEVVPVLVDRAAMPAPAAPPDPPTVLFVGRLAPHKRQDQLIKAFSLYRARRAPDARLVLVGEPINPAYGKAIVALGEELAPGAVTVEWGVANKQLWDRYRSAHVFACLSEHEGFCIPLVEAMHFGLPTIARPVGGVPEVVGDAAVLADDDDPAVWAELIHLAAGDQELRAELARRAQPRLEHFGLDAVTARLRRVLETVGA